MPEALRAAGVEVRVHDQLFPQATQDVDWLREAGANGWIVITRDDRIRYNQLENTIDIETYDRYAEKLREELTLARIDRHSGQLEELDVEGILAFAERVLPRAADLWVQAPLEQRSYLRGIESGNEGLVGRLGIEPRAL